MESIHLIGKTKDGVWIQPINNDIDVTTPEALEVFGYLFHKAAAEPVGLIRTQQEGDKVQPYHSYFRAPATPEHEEAMVGAILRVMAGGTGHLDPNRPYAAEALIRDTELLAELRIESTSEETDGR
jgi:hypothetical protein